MLELPTMDFSGMGLQKNHQQKLRHHWALVCQANARTNLTAIADEASATWLHYRDSLQALPHLTAGPLVDFGSGAGFPGLVLAIVRPQWAVTLVEPRRKRVEFLRHAVSELALPQVTVLQGKLESPPPGQFAHALTRATFADPARFLTARPWIKPGGTLIAWRTADSPPCPGEVQRVDYTLHTTPTPRRRCLAIMQF